MNAHSGDFGNPRECDGAAFLDQTGRHPALDILILSHKPQPTLFLGRGGRLVFGSERSARLLRAWFRKKPKEIEAVFCAINHGQCVNRPICDRNVNEIIKNSVVKVKRCKRPSDLEVSGHSLSVGAAQDLLIKGYDLAAIMRAGGWSNAATVSKYLRFSQHNIWK